MEYGEGQERGAGLETVRALHQTVTALREALEESKNEILQLKSQAWPGESVQETLQNLSIENHILRRKILGIYPQTTCKDLDLKQSALDKEFKEDTHILNDQLKEYEKTIEDKPTKDIDFVNGKYFLY